MSVELLDAENSTRIGTLARVDVDELGRRQRASLHLEGQTGLHSPAEALAFMQHVGIALRYGAASSLPLASMYRATQRHVPEPEDEKLAHARAFELTNALLQGGQVVEINLIAERLSLAHERVLPVVYALRRRSQESRLSAAAGEAFRFIEANESATSGDIRRLLRAEGQPRPDAADLALSELQRELLVDRGPSSGLSTGVFYLSREGYPYRVFSTAHAGIILSASRLSRTEAARDLLTAYLSAAVFATERQLATLFKALLQLDEIRTCVQGLEEQGVVKRVQKLIVARTSTETERAG